MKAIVYHHYGSPAVLQLIDTPRPTPADHEVLVSIHAASVNPADWHLMRADPVLVRLDGGLRQPRNPRLGSDIAGVVTQIGRSVTQLKVGDAVFGDLSGVGLGALAEFVCVPAALLAIKPDQLSFEQAAAVPLAAGTALQGLRNTGKIQSGQKVLINGASGGVGTFAVQIAKAFGTEVTGVCSTRNLELVRSIGADHVIDYTQVDFTRQGAQYDLIFDAVGNRSVSELRRALKPQGIAAVAGFNTLSRLFEHMLLGPLTSLGKNTKVGLMATAKASQDDLKVIATMLEMGQVVPVIDRCYPLSETAEAIRYLETGRARGKVVITIMPSAGSTSQ